MRKATVAAAAIAAVLALVAPGGPAHADDAADVARIQSQLDSLTDQYAEAQTEAASARDTYDKAVEEMSDLQLRAESAQAQVTKTTKAYDLASDQLTQLAAASGYMTSQVQQLGMVLGAEGMSDALRQADALDQIGGSIGDAYAVMTAAKNNAEHAAAQQREVVKAQKAAIATMDRAKQDADDAVDELAARKVALESKRDTLIAQIAEAKRISEQKAREEQEARERQRQQQAARAEQAERSSGSTGGTGAGSGSNSGTKPAPPKPAAPPAPVQPGGGGRKIGAVPAAYRGWVAQAGSLCSGVSASVIAAQIHTESHWNPNAVSSMGAQGLTQFMPGTWAAWGRDADGNGRVSPFDPGDAIMTQGAYMCALRAEMASYQAKGRVSGDLLSLTLAAYNAGSGNVLKHKGVPPFGETRAYISKIRSLAASTYA